MAAHPSQVELMTLRREIEEFIRVNGFPHDFINRELGLSDDLKITVPLTGRQLDKISHIMDRKMEEATYGNGDFKAYTKIWQAIFFLSTESDKNIVHTIMVERGLLPPSVLSCPPEGTPPEATVLVEQRKSPHSSPVSAAAASSSSMPSASMPSSSMSSSAIPSSLSTSPIYSDASHTSPSSGAGAHTPPSPPSLAPEEQPGSITHGLPTRPGKPKGVPIEPGDEAYEALRRREEAKAARSAVEAARAVEPVRATISATVGPRAAAASVAAAAASSGGAFPVVAMLGRVAGGGAAGAVGKSAITGITTQKATTAFELEIRQYIQSIDDIEKILQSKGRALTFEQTLELTEIKNGLTGFLDKAPISLTVHDQEILNGLKLRTTKVKNDYLISPPSLPHPGR